MRTPEPTPAPMLFASSFFLLPKAAPPPPKPKLTREMGISVTPSGVWMGWPTMVLVSTISRTLAMLSCIISLRGFFFSMFLYSFQAPRHAASVFDSFGSSAGGGEASFLNRKYHFSRLPPARRPTDTRSQGRRDRPTSAIKSICSR